MTRPTCRAGRTTDGTDEEWPQERVGSTGILRIQSIREIREIRGQNHFRERQRDRVCPGPSLSGSTPGEGGEKSTQDVMTLKVGTAEAQRGTI